ncbi:MAG: hypothetical protein CO186_08325 [Zetaproteobacteria bacterium CG_4_9_14_3_um_filter_49_83]|nr:MAG: hypothetical protein AUJ56_00995 [Zetaproteobacteria bacterium CG1_02_49_23]PIQ30313.1 MAG: hypothetical protein COW62_12910 [Zetaproteobacteria bacterium CG17_big_fil_post_rev_8_21_14_2_50_50_13]PIV29566.1 MAG: hypothetical protein COS35_11355 [Zetaproteobacteria bacterium CG02_land_8_20_14_3_00_50_9]PIY55241.1 MAG: hypothetical protein COZ00_10515 [Zetaproteobacteria bacterium CG_4_10_14_0_8_um_filter_49_80]PJA34976.1 MAG: hypothetical protein CO186_08325 [Zetaproteobacteria bacterium
MKIKKPNPHVHCAIIGSGVAGALLARTVAAAGRSVHILEAGGSIARHLAVDTYQGALDRNLTSPFPEWPKAPYPRDNDPKAYYGDQSPEFHPSFIKGVGGTTWHWTGMTPRFLPRDFKLKTHYQIGDDWPISYEELERYYVKAEKALGVAGNSDNDHGSPRSDKYPMPAIPMPYSDQVVARRLKALGIEVDAMPAARNSREYHDRPACCGYGTCTPICPIGATYSADTDIRKAVELGAELTTNAVVSKLEVDPAGRISRAYFKRPDGSTHYISADNFVLACGTIETARLLLMSAAENCPDGVANRSGMVGRNLMDHVLMQCNYVMEEPLYMGRGPLSVSTVLTGRDGDFRKSHAAAKIFLGNDRNVGLVAADLLADAENFPDILDKMRHRLIHKGMIGAEIEQLPLTSNRVQLDKTRLDHHGLPMPTIQLELSDYTLRGVKKWQRYLTDLVEQIGGNNAEVKTSLTSHHTCGTARMGDGPRHSVVDKHCRAHEYPNLFVIGGSVFPTIGTANPTLTIAALALRLADHIKKY